MKTCRISTKLFVLAAAVFLLGATIAGITQRQDSPVTRVPICVKDNGQLRMLVGNNSACDPSERRMEWVVGGEVTDIQLGQGLVGSREDGIMQLAVDPSIIAGCTGCRGGKVFAGFNDGPGEISSNQFSDNEIAELNLPAGDYAIFAKLTLETLPGDFGYQQQVTCRLTAGADFDKGEVIMEKDHIERPGFDDGSNVMGLTLQVVHRFSAPGSVVLSGFHGPPFGDPPQVLFRNLKIIAIEVSDISNVFLGGN
jgi:hypothetical protein